MMPNLNPNPSPWLTRATLSRHAPELTGRYEFMIDNVMLLLKGTLSGRSASELMKQCHPLGFFKVRYRDVWG